MKTLKDKVNIWNTIIEVMFLIFGILAISTDNIIAILKVILGYLIWEKAGKMIRTEEGEYEIGSKAK